MIDPWLQISIGIVMGILVGLFVWSIFRYEERRIVLMYKELSDK